MLLPGDIKRSFVPGRCDFDGHFFGHGTSVVAVGDLRSAFATCYINHVAALSEEIQGGLDSKLNRGNHDLLVVEHSL